MNCTSKGVKLDSNDAFRSYPGKYCFTMLAKKSRLMKGC